MLSTLFLGVYTKTKKSNNKELNERRGLAQGEKTLLEWQEKYHRIYHNFPLRRAKARALP